METQYSFVLGPSELDNCRW